MWTRVYGWIYKPCILSFLRRLVNNNKHFIVFAEQLLTLRKWVLLRPWICGRDLLKMLDDTPCAWLVILLGPKWNQSEQPQTQWHFSDQDAGTNSRVWKWTSCYISLLSSPCFLGRTKKLPTKDFLTRWEHWLHSESEALQSSCPSKRPSKCDVTMC